MAQITETGITESAPADLKPSQETKQVVFEHKLPGVWGKVYSTESKSGKPSVFARFRRYRKVNDGYEDNSFINSMTDCENAIEVLYEVKKFMRSFYDNRDSE